MQKTPSIWMGLSVLLGLMCLPFIAMAQPNDDCVNAEVITISNNGFGFGVFASDTISLNGATSELGEFFPATVPNGKSVWYRFSVPTTRTVRILLDQTGNMPVSSAGWALYRDVGCHPGLSDGLEPFVSNIEGFTHSCLRAGDYLLQVGADLNANGDIFIHLEVSNATSPEVDYDHAAHAYDFQVVSGINSPRATNYEVGCQSYFQGEKLCPDSSYTKTTWHVFTTDNHIDYLRFEVRESPFDNTISALRTFGYALYQGDVRVDSTGIPLIDSCRVLNQAFSSTRPSAFYICELLPNTTYSIQLLFPTDYFGRLSLNIHEQGGGQTAGPDPATLPASHQLGPLSLGTTYQVTDFMACNARTNLYACGTNIQDSIYINGGTTPYDLNWWTTFTLTSQADMNFWHDQVSSQPSLQIRIFRGSAAANCNLPLVTTFSATSPHLVPCLTAGTYSVQVLGQLKSPVWPYYTSNLGKSARLNIELAQVSNNKYGRFTATHIDSINGLMNLQPGQTYNSTINYFDCSTTVMPPGDSCASANDRAMYRVININQDGILVVGGGDWQHYRYKLFRGNAATSPVTNGILTALTDQACCQSTYYDFKVCVTNGTYTLVTYGDVLDINRSDAPWVKLDTFPATLYTNPTSPEDLDTLKLTNTITATATRFDCNDNPLTILGNAPCGNSTKQVYREFYLADSASLDFDNLGSRYHWGGGVRHRLFAGRISNNSLTSMLRDCFSSFDMSSCDKLPPGYYTVVSYHSGGTFANPTYCSGTGAGVGDLTAFRISPNPPYPKPRFNTFAKAEQVNGGTNIDWYAHTQHTDTIPQTGTLYILGTEYFNCDPDTAFPAGIVACNPIHNRVSYRVFTLARPSYVYIRGAVDQSRLYQGDITALAAPYTIVHDCFSSVMRMCLQPGTYTLVSFVGNNYIGYTATPQIYLDSLGVSKYDHAAAAYNFGNMPLDSVEYFAQPGAALDVLGRPASNDFIFCPTQAYATEPRDECPLGSATLPYSVPFPTNPRQTLWYTFELTGPGLATVSVYPLTVGKVGRLPFSIYKVSNNYPLIDSIDANMQLVATSQGYYCWEQAQTLTIFRDPCAGITTDRYVVLVDRNAYRAYDSYQPNMQVQVGIRFDDILGTTVRYDHYSQANLITANPSVVCNPPYPPTVLTGGTFSGCEGNLSCATKDPTDQNTCGQKTIWYRFEVGNSGRIRINYTRTDNATTSYHADDIQLYRAIVPGDSTTSGLQRVALSSINANNPAFPGNFTWGQSCYVAGTYYLMITGCNFPNATVYPRVWMDHFPGDYCQDSLQLTVDTTGTFQVSGTVDCWTIGEGPGEQDSVAMSCLGTPAGKKSGWFHISITDTAKMDLDISLTESTTATALQVLYRVGNGSCSAMTFENCVDDGAFITLNLKCRRDSGLWIHVVVPEYATGTVDLTVVATPSTDQSCEPLDPFEPSASFDFSSGCIGDVIQFINQSTIGDSLTYLWSFGDGFTSTLQSPSHKYLTADTFLVRLIVSRGSKADTSERLIFIYPKPQTAHTHPGGNIAGNPVTFNNTTTNTLNNATYYWNFCAGGGFCSASIRTYAGQNPPPVTYSVPGTYLVCLTVTNGNCDSTYCDTVVVELLDFFSGGPYDGFNLDNDRPCDTINIFTGGPYDGFGTDDDRQCDTINFFTGGPYDGFDMDDDRQCDTINFFTGGPYDGFDTERSNDACPDTMQSIYSGGPYDGADADLIIRNCPEQSVWAGGPYDGAGSALLMGHCDQINFFTGGPYDGFDLDDDRQCDTINFFTGGPYDGFDMDDDRQCDTINFFTGGPYDGFDTDDDRQCMPINFFTGGPYDGFDVQSSGDIELQGATVCRGETAVLHSSFETDWYDQAVGGNLLAAGMDSLVLSNLQQTTLVYADAACGRTGREGVAASVIDSIDANFTETLNCQLTSSFFVSQALTPGISQATVGAGLPISAFGFHGLPPAPDRLTFSSATSSNYNFLTDNSINSRGWRSGGTNGATFWVQWQYRQPRAVDRIEFWNYGNNPDAYPVMARLYFSTGGPWILSNVFLKDELLNKRFDSGPICETRGKYAVRWKLEVDAGPNTTLEWSQFQAHANQAVSGGNVSWNFGDGTPVVQGNSVIHVFTDSGDYVVDMTVTDPTCGCPGIFTKTIHVPYCAILAGLEQQLSGAWVKDDEIELNWIVEGTYDKAYLEKYEDGRWQHRYTFSPGQQSYFYRDRDPVYDMDNLYRVKAMIDGQAKFSNLVQLRATLSTQSLRLYPNPADGNSVSLSLFLPEEKNVQVDLLDILGRDISMKLIEDRFKGRKTFEIPIQGLAEGQYLVRVWIGGKAEVLKLIVWR